MTKDEIHSRWSEFIEYPEDSSGLYVTTTSALLFAEMIAEDCGKDLVALIKKVHTAKGRYHTQLAVCDLYDAVGLANERPKK